MDALICYITKQKGIAWPEKKKMARVMRAVEERFAGGSLHTMRMEKLKAQIRFYGEVLPCMAKVIEFLATVQRSSEPLGFCLDYLPAC